jgi:hypothetical protein
VLYPYSSKGTFSIETNKTTAMNKSNLDKTDNNAGNMNQANEKTPIDAKDASRNEERDQRIGQEPDTDRLRSERESTMNRDPE